MKKLLTVFCVLGVFSAPAQTLFTYGNKAVSADEFLRAFQKNNNAGRDEKAVKEYLDLYIASKLKVAEAKENKLDTLPQLKIDLAALRQQILPAYLADKESLDKLVKEAHARSQKDLHIAHLFIAFSKGGVTDTLAAAKKRAEVMSKLSKGLSFSEAARQYSDDPSAQSNGGDMGWLTAFGLPYELETIIYATPAGIISPVYTSKAGYHLFKNLGERKAIGRMKAAQILLAFPPGADEAYKTRLKKTIDSLYTRLQAGDDFGKLATAFSNDVVSAASNGQMQEFGAGDYSPAFETAAFALAKDGAVSKPFLTEHGYHIVKRLELRPVAAALSQATADNLRSKIESSDRAAVTKAVLTQKILAQAGYKFLLSSTRELWAFTDSVVLGNTPAVKLTINPVTPVAKLGSRTIRVKDWVDHAQTSRFRPNGTLKTYPDLWEEFVQTTALQQYEEHLEEYNEDFRRQLSEFADGNLFFEAMQQKVWTPAQSDTAALLEHYKKHKASYVWKPSADAVFFYGADAVVATAFHSALKKTPANWRTLLNNYSEQITADSGRFELTQIQKSSKERLAAGMLTVPFTNKADNTVSFVYILQLHPTEEPRNFADARGLVINDYQAGLEKAWVSELQKKHPVKVNDTVWKEVVKKVASPPAPGRS
ncbi:MAG TPA: peptidylprolyl isomerase [Flavisolibacter sp.]|nr:peptidylprolyl isomerase [Flavisolibacter sp.]